MISIRKSAPPPESMEIVRDDKVIGKVQQSPKCSFKWHASIELPFPSYGYVMIQGFADTPEEAVKNAVTKGIEDNITAKRCINQFSEELNTGD